MYINKLITLLMVFLFSLQSFAGVPQAASLVQMGGQISTTGLLMPESAWISSGYFAVVAGVNTATTSNFLGFYKMSSGGGQYSVTTGKTAYCPGFYIRGAASFGGEFGYGTASFTNNTATPPTGAVYYGPGTGTIGVYADASTSQAGGYNWIPTPMSFPSAVYPFFQTDTASGVVVVLICKEQ